jgi:hypothetical protein
MEGTTMARKQTQKERIAFLESENNLLERRALEAYRERDDARNALASVTIGAKGDDVHRLRLAAVAYPQDEPKSIGWDDLAQFYGQHREDLDKIKKAIFELAEDDGITADVDSVEDIVSTLEAVKDKVKLYRELKTSVAEGLEIEDGDPDDVQVAATEKIQEEGLGSKVREDALELLREMGYDVTVLVPKYSGGPVLDLADPHAVTELRRQGRR